MSEENLFFFTHQVDQIFVILTWDKNNFSKICLQKIY